MVLKEDPFSLLPLTLPGLLGLFLPLLGEGLLPRTDSAGKRLLGLGLLSGAAG